MAEAAKDNPPASSVSLKGEEKYAVFGIGNALVDISAPMSMEDLTGYNLKPGNAILTDKENPYTKVFEQLKSHKDVQYISGGATMNVIRVANWMLPGRKCALGGILGKDTEGKEFKKCLGGESLDYAFYEQEKPTGRCAVCIVDKERSMVADLNCNNDFPQKDPDFLGTTAKGLWENAEVIYISGFWLTVYPEGMKKIGEHCVSTNQKFITNISAPFLAQFFTQQMTALFPYVDVLFGNESEAEALAIALNLAKKGDSMDLPKLAQAFAQKIDPEGKRGARVIITQGGDPVIIATALSIKLFSIPPLDKKDIVDFNGAGDAFAGGFIAAMTEGKSEGECVHWGAYSAQFIIKTSGTQFGTNKAQIPAVPAALTF